MALRGARVERLQWRLAEKMVKLRYDATERPAASVVGVSYSYLTDVP